METLPPKPQSWEKVVLTLIFIGLFIWSTIATEADLAALFQNFDEFAEIFIQMIAPDWSYIDRVWDPLIETVKMAIFGTSLGALFAFPYALLMARNIISNPVITSVLRFILNIIRTIPDLLLAALFVAIVGIGPVAGVITLAIMSFGMIGKLFYEAIETVDEGPIEAMTALGANKLQIIRFAVLPQIMTYFISYTLYAFEINVRASTVLGYIGAGGIGLLLQISLSQFRYDRTGLIVLVIFFAVILIDWLSNRSRRELMR